MALSTNCFIGLPLVTLQAQQALYAEAISEIVLTGQSYTHNNRTFNAADLDKIKETLFEINQAIGKALGTGGVRVAHPIICRN